MKTTHTRVKSATNPPEPLTQKFQIKRFDDPTFMKNIVVDENEDPESVALECLGFFVITEMTNTI